MIVVIDYGMGNLRSVSKALEHLGGQVVVSSDPDVLETADKAVLPGVGAFGDAVMELERSGLTASVKRFLHSGKPFLGICLGLQLLFEDSEESAGSDGLAYVPGSVKRFNDDVMKVPHMGWNQIQVKQERHPMLDGIKSGDYFYFVHSFFGACKNHDDDAAVCEYANQTFTAALAKGSVFATQFHPEKSQNAGLRILKNFLQWRPS